MHPTEVIDRVLRDYLGPLMKSRGFRKSGPRFWLDHGEVIDYVDLQKSQWNSQERAQFTINLGVYWPVIGGFAGNPRAGRPLQQYECTISERIGSLFGRGLDHWWEVPSVADARQIGPDVCRKVSDFGFPWLEAMHDAKRMLAYYQQKPCLFAEQLTRDYLRRNRQKK